MGYKRKMKIYELHFEGEEFEGLVVKAKSMSVDGFLNVLSLSQSAEDPATQRELFTVFAGQLLEWNLEDEDDKPVPPTIEGILSQEFAFIMEVIGTWIKEISDVPVPLEPRSQSGSNSLMASIPMESM